MVLLLNKNSLYSTFGVNDFNLLEQNIQSMAPSMVEYYLSDLCNGNEDTYLNKRNIQESINIGEYSIYLDYNEDVYLEISDVQEELLESPSLW